MPPSGIRQRVSSYSVDPRGRNYTVVAFRHYVFELVELCTPRSMHVACFYFEIEIIHSMRMSSKTRKKSSAYKNVETCSPLWKWIACCREKKKKPTDVLMLTSVRYMINHTRKRLDSGMQSVGRERPRVYSAVMNINIVPTNMMNSGFCGIIAQPPAKEKP